MKYLKHYTVFILLIVYSCGPIRDKEKASQYYDKYSSIMTPYKEGTEGILKDTRRLLEVQLQSVGHIKLNYQDSVKEQALVMKFENLAHQTIIKLKALEEFPESDLKDSAIKFVQTSSNAILGAYRQIAIPFQDLNTPIDQNSIDSLTVKFRNDLIEANEEFRTKQREFLENFDLPINN